MFVWPQEVVVCHPKRQIVVGTFDVIEAIGRMIGFLIGSVKSFDYLLVWTMFGGYLIIVGKTDDTGDIELNFFAKLTEKLLSR